jgi:hypothetical protein
MPAPNVAGRELRRTRVGASEVAALVEPGVHPFVTPADIYARIVAGVERAPTGTTRMRLGSDLEGYVGKRWREATGMPILRSTRTYVHADVPLAATPDFYVPHDELLEVKVDRGGWSDEWVDLPRRVFWQVVAQLACTGRRRGHVGALVGSELRRYVVERDAGAEAELVDAVARFDREHLAPHVPPDPVPDELVLIVAPRPVDVGDAAGAIALAGEALADLMSRGRELDAMRDELRGQLARYMAEHGYRLLRGPTWRAEVREAANGRRQLYMYPDARRVSA